MAIPVVEFQERDTKLERFLGSQIRLLNFENWSGGELSKLGIILENKVI